MSKRMFKTPELMPVADARKSIGNGLKVKEIDLKMVEVQYQNKTSDGSLRFPVFIRFRKDKD